MTTTHPPSNGNEQSDQESLSRVIIVDDSVVIRNHIRRLLESQGGVAIVATASDGQAAVDALRRTPADVVILDIEMPVMDGLTAIPLLKVIDPHVQIVMASTLTKKNAEISLKALALGATDCVPKPNSMQETEGGSVESFSRELVEKVKALSVLARKRGVRLSTTKIYRPPITPAVPPEKKKIELRQLIKQRPDVIAMGSSTGGPQALFEVVKSMGALLTQPIVITQHMPPSFTSILAEHISRQCQVTCLEAKDDDILKPGNYYVAPGDYHMQFVRKSDGTAIKLNKDPAENFCRPSVDPMMRSLIDIYKSKILAVILTGMGQDGLKGCQKIVAGGGTVIAQDEATSVVWGMPGAVAQAGICSAVLPLTEIGPVTRKLAAGNGL
jgi:two-component system chemotaxis response regulator CheB